MSWPKRVDLKGKTIVITGASSGIGAAVALACAKEGMNLVLGARRTDRLHEIALKAREHDIHALISRCDVASDDDVKNLMQAAMERFGRLDMLLANAGYGLFESVEKTSDQAMRDLFEVNYYGTLRAIRHALPLIRQGREGGHILITSSIVSEISPPMYGAYAATKAAQDAIASSLRAELYPEQIVVTSIHPIGTRTEFFDLAKHPHHAASPMTALQSGEEGNRRSARKGGKEGQEGMQTPEQVAQKIVAAMKRPCAEVWPHVPSRWAVGLATMLPGLASWGMRQYVAQMAKRAERSK